MGLRGVALWTFFIAYHAQAQDTSQPNRSIENRMGQVYVTWGYNRAYYGKSDIHFVGEHYDFTLHQARAEDMPEPFDPDVYCNISQFTVPQFNFRAGYYFSDNTAISFGWDHMKYRLIQTQLLSISGTISEEEYGL